VNLLWAGTACFLYWDRQGALLPLGAAVALWGVAGWLVARSARARRLEAVCAAMGFTFTGELSPTRLKALGAFQALSPTQAPAAYNMMEGQREGRSVALLELRYCLGGRTELPSPRTVVVVANSLAAPPPARDFARHFRARRPAAAAVPEAEPGAAPAVAAAVADLPAGGPEFRLEPLGPGDWLWQRFCGLDTPFRHHPAFTKRYRLDGPCGDEARRALRPEVLDHFAAHPGWHVEVLGGRLLAHRKGPCDPADCPALIAEVVAMYRMLMRACSESQDVTPCPSGGPSCLVH
jgi:hypothetical protein